MNNKVSVVSGICLRGFIMLLTNDKLFDLIDSCCCELIDQDDDYQYVQGDDWSILDLVQELKRSGYDPQINRGHRELTVVRF